MRVLLSALAFLACSGCSVFAGALAEGATANTCREPGPHDAAGPGQVICTAPDGTESVRSADRAD